MKKSCPRLMMVSLTPKTLILMTLTPMKLDLDGGKVKKKGRKGKGKVVRVYARGAQLQMLSSQAQSW